MPPKKLINRSRPVGSRKPPKTPKTEPAPVPADWSESKQSTDWNIAGSTSTNGSISNVSSNVITPSTVTSKAQSYTGLSQVGNGLSFPKFDPNQYFSTDLFKDTSALERTTKETADDLVQSIEEKRQTVRVATANIQLNQDVQIG